MADISLHLPRFDRPILGRLRDALHQRRLERELLLGTERLAGLSPHLLRDVGLSYDQPERQADLIFGRT